MSTACPICAAPLRPDLSDCPLSGTFEKSCPRDLAADDFIELSRALREATAAVVQVDRVLPGPADHQVQVTVAVHVACSQAPGLVAVQENSNTFKEVNHV